MKKNIKHEKKIPPYQNKTTLTVYLVLRALVIFVLVRAAASSGFSCIFISYFLQIFGRFGFPTDRREFLEIRKFFLIFSEKTVYKSLFPCYNILDFRAWRTRPSRHNPSWF